MKEDIYHKRQTLFDKTDWEWRLKIDALIECSGTGKTRTIRWVDISKIRLCFAPTRFKPWRFYCRLHSVQGDVVEIDNVDTCGVGDFKNTDVLFVPFIRALLDRVALARPDLKVRLGEDPVHYLFHLLFVTGSFALLILTIIVLPVPFAFWPGTALIKAGFMLLCVPVLGKWAMRGFPRSVRITEVLPRHLPYCSS